MKKNSKLDNIKLKPRENKLRNDFKNSKKNLNKSILNSYYESETSYDLLDEKNDKKTRNFDIDLSPDSSFLINLNIDENDYDSKCGISSNDSDSKASSIFSRMSFHKSRSNSLIAEFNIIADVKTITQLSQKDKDEFLEKYLNPIKSNCNLNINHFSLICSIGEGSFGRVVLAYHRKNNKFYAIKILKKEKLVRYNQIDHTINERNILYACKHPNIVKLYTSFKDNTNIYFVTDLHCHNDLYTLLKQKKRFQEPQSKFYAANIFLALEYLHINHVIYRDLKPENILITSNGYLKLTDFGFAKRVKGFTTTICGTPDYISPEVLSSAPYGKSADWWAFGIFIFELNAGKPPFVSEKPNDSSSIYDLILDGTLKIPGNFSPLLKDICEKLLEKNVKLRLGCLKHESNDIRDHEWFDSIDWTRIYKQTFPSPYVPEKKKPLDLISKNSLINEKSISTSPKNKYEIEFEDF